MVGGPVPGAMAGLVAASTAGWRAENRGAAQRLIACYEVLQECIRQGQSGTDDDGRPAHALIDSFDVAVNYLVAAMPISAHRANNMLVLADDLHVRYPAVLDALSQGLLEVRIAKVMADQMATVDPDILPLVQQQVVEDYLAGLAAGQRQGHGAIRDRIDSIINRHDRDAVRERRTDAARTRGVHLRKGVDGMAHLSATLASEEAALLAEAIDHRVTDHRTAESRAHAAAVAAARAEGQPEPADDSEHYPIAERRADALLSLIFGDTTHTHTRTHTNTSTGTGTNPDPSTGAGTGTGAGGGAAGRDSGAGTGGLAPLRPQVTVISGPTPSGAASGAVVEFTRTGQAALNALQAMLAASHGASLEQIDPRIGAADDANAAGRYRPSAQLARRIRLRDGTCRHPGCHVPAADCDLDHVRPFNHTNPARGGRTIEANLMCLCRRHHRFKTFSDWTYHLDPDGTLTLTAPDGALTRTRPAGPLGTYRRENARTEAHNWNTQQRRNPDPGTTTGEQPRPEPAYPTRRATRLATERARTTANPTRATSSTGPGRPRPPQPGRWWQRTTPTHSPIETGIRTLLEHDTDPPPF